jgi:DegV family protein with EDD domain
MSKQNVRILSDGTIDLPPSWVEELNIGILPTQIIIEDREKPYKQYYDITSEEFFEKLDKCKEIPTTSVPRQGDVFKMYQQSLKDFDSLIVFGHSSKISSSWALAKKVADQMFPNEDITVVDTETITIMEGLIVYEAAKMAKKGISKEDILKRVKELIPKAHGIAILQSLDHLRKGGRINIAQHLLGSLVGFKPMVTVEDGLVKNIGKVRGYNKGMELLKKSLPEILKGLETETLIILHATMSDAAKELEEAIIAQENTPQQVKISWIGPVLGTHVGPNVIGLAWLGEWDKDWFQNK